jgi:hypothetical protein
MKIFYILTFILTVSTQVKSQDRLPPAPPSEPKVRIIKFYPNPATSIINFDFQKGYEKNLNFIIFNMLGKKVYEAVNVDSRTTVNLSDFYRGIYIFQLKDKNGKLVDSGKFQVSK